jgi:hypothetical protein
MSTVISAVRIHQTIDKSLVEEEAHRFCGGLGFLC